MKLRRNKQVYRLIGSGSLIAGLLLLAACSKTSSNDNPKKSQEERTIVQNVHQIEVSTISGESKKLEEYKGKVLLVVNVASECGFTPQYKTLQELYETYADQGLVVMGFPANDFGKQEPGSNEQIKTFCESRFGVTFPMFEKVTVKGDGQHPLYQALTQAHGDVSWNFNKFLIDRDGNSVARFESAVEPMGTELRQKIEALLNKNG